MVAVAAVAHTVTLIEMAKQIAAVTHCVTAKISRALRVWDSVCLSGCVNCWSRLRQEPAVFTTTK